MILSFINIRKVPREMLKTSGFALGFQHLALGFQHLPRGLANVNEWKIMFDPYMQPCRNVHVQGINGMLNHLEPRIYALTVPLVLLSLIVNLSCQIAKNSV